MSWEESTIAEYLYDAAEFGELFEQEFAEIVDAAARMEYAANVPLQFSRPSPFPKAIVIQIAETFLTDSDAVAWAQTSRTQFSELKQFRIRRSVQWSRHVGEWTIGQPVQLEINHPTLDLPTSHRILTNLPQSVRKIYRMFDASCNFPAHLTSLAIATHSAPPAFLPDSITELTLFLTEPFVHTIQLPQLLRTLDLDRTECALSGLHIPDSVTHLSFGYSWNLPIKEMPKLPSNLLFLKFGKYFDQQIEPLKLPESITSLQFGEDHKLGEPGITTSAFNRSIEQLTLPPNLTHLGLGTSFRQKLRLWNLPLCLTSLNLPFTWYHAWHDLSLPPNLSCLRIPISSTKEPLSGLRLPPGIEELITLPKFNDSLSRVCLPRSLKKLHLGDTFNHSLHDVTWPSALEEIRFGWTIYYEGGPYDHPIKPGDFPSTLRRLIIDRPLSERYEMIQLPSNLTSISLSYHTTGNFSGFTLPVSLLHLDIGRDGGLMDIRSMPVLPSNLRILSLNGTWKDLSELSPLLPESLRVLRLHGFVQSPLDRLIFPSQLVEFHLSDPEYTCDPFAPDVRWPNSLRVLTINPENLLLLHQPLNVPPNLQWLQIISFSEQHRRSAAEGRLPPSCSMTKAVKWQDRLEWIMKQYT